jgi:hypothetical protein
MKNAKTQNRGLLQSACGRSRNARATGIAPVDSRRNPKEWHMVVKRRAAQQPVVRRRTPRAHAAHQLLLGAAMLLLPALADAALPGRGLGVVVERVISALL